MKAVIIQAAGNAVVAEVQEPRLRPEHYKVKTVAIGLNPSARTRFLLTMR